MATSYSSTATQVKACTVCQSPNSIRCKGCIEGLDVNGQALPTYYCGKVCQKADWKTHKKACSDANARKMLYRAGDVLQAIFYMYRETAFDCLLTDIATTEDGKIHMYEGWYKPDQVLAPFPQDIKIDEQTKKAVFTHNGCDEAMVTMHLLVKKLLSGICSEIQELAFDAKKGMRLTVYHYVNGKFDNQDHMHEVFHAKLQNGEEYIIDLAGAQYKNSATVKTFERFNGEFIDRIRELNDLGHESACRYSEILSASQTKIQTQILISLWKISRCIAENEGFVKALTQTGVKNLLDAQESHYQHCMDTIIGVAKSDIEFEVQRVQEDIARQVEAIERKKETGLSDVEGKSSKQETSDVTGMQQKDQDQPVDEKVCTAEELNKSDDADEDDDKEDDGEDDQDEEEDAEEAEEDGGQSLAQHMKQMQLE